MLYEPSTGSFGEPSLPTLASVAGRIWDSDIADLLEQHTEDKVSMVHHFVSMVAACHAARGCSREALGWRRWFSRSFEHNMFFASKDY